MMSLADEIFQESLQINEMVMKH
ncbi:conserved hypothetical protein [Xenorhabdus nematophila F1]|uniref:Uncharacterized protein n=1 Tax=Xenorhabdus nematophila (strain ATCC 19061 / DSM 3370 / CCUG 14189 / LMG 1036 / NCIMB 9965 / AN6) TaxID=406817 RepID=D3VAR3_XENNA|nr:hypothetical protein XNC1_1436 [Xenorhabdus nematophila ATCC 19061]CCW31165.1 conserved hypothetical protein [Xenorhabdus nematophila F1]CEK22392.1 hypothetical protein XNC2_1398 [Xenorhabdus nematophila AN6/1]